MRTGLRTLVAGLGLLTVMAGGTVHAGQTGITPQGQWLAHELDDMGVETKWISGAHVDWRTGLPDGRPETLPGHHTHCSAFVASTAEHLGVYILRPPEHGQVLLANAQSEWLATAGHAAGWRRLDGPEEAQDAANRGDLVVASYHNHHDDKPGHIAIIRPGAKTAENLSIDGPDVIQAGTRNASSISLKAGFAGHPHAWNDNEIDYYAHPIKVTSDDPGRSSMTPK